MADYIPELIECKMKLAESEDRCNEKSNKIRKMAKEISELRLELQEIYQKYEESQEVVQSLISEKKSMKLQLDELKDRSIFSKTETQETEEEEVRTPDQFLEITSNQHEGSSSWQYFLENWDRLGLAAKLRMKHLAKKGIPSKFRGDVWTKKAQNHLHITPHLFSVLLNRAKLSAENEREENGSSLIPLDLKRTLGGLQVFQKEQPLHQSLNDLLEAFAAYRPDTGYIQGMAYLGAMLILHLNTYRAFECFANMVFGSEMLRVFYSFDMQGIQGYYRVFEHFMKKKTPAVFKFFKQMDITPDAYLLEWVYTLYSRCFPIEVVSYIWDSYFFEGDSFIFRVGLAILTYLDSKFKADAQADMIPALTDLSSHFTEHKALFRIIDKIYINENKIKSLRKKLI